MRAVVATSALLSAGLAAGTARADSTITIATVNNGDMVVMQKLSLQFEQQHPDIHLRWVVLEENVLRQRVTTDIATKAGQFDVMTVGNYEVPIWAKQKWLEPMDNLPASYGVDDILKPVRDGLTYDGKLYGLPFYAESAMTYYRTDLFEKAGIKMPDAPTYEQIRQFADKITDKANQVYGICLRGKPGWGENMAFVTALVNAEGGQWFNAQWKPTIDTPEWRRAITYYDDILKADGPPGTRQSTYDSPEYKQAAPFADFVAKAISVANPTGQTKSPRPYEGAQFVAIPEFQGIGTQVGQTIAGTLSGQSTVEQGLKTAQAATERTIRQAGYPKK